MKSLKKYTVSRPTEKNILRNTAKVCQVNTCPSCPYFNRSCMDNCEVRGGILISEFGFRKYSRPSTWWWRKGFNLPEELEFIPTLDQIKMAIKNLTLSGLDECDLVW